MFRWLAALVVVVGLSLGQNAYALGLGEITTRSALNEPMLAQIALLGATQEELSGLEVKLASAETFERYGIEKQTFLQELKFKIRGGAQPYVEVTSSQPISEPFVTMLIEAVWPRGRLLREYTVLLDPPTFKAPPAAAASQPATRAAQTRRPAANQGQIRRSAPTTSAPSISGDQYQVQRNDTLWEIAKRIQPDNSVSINQVMVSIYQANPGAFGGNINRLNAGAVLNLPSEQSLVQINRSAALQEVRRQNQDWRGGDGGSLTLVAPDDDAGVGSASAGETSSGSTVSAGNAAEVAALRRELQEKENQLRVRNEELARLEAALSARNADAGESTDPVSTQDLYGDTDPATEVVDPATEEAPAVPDTGATDIFAEDPTVESDPVATAEPEEPVVEEPAPSRTPAVVTTTKPEPSLIEKLTGSIWTYVGAGVLAILGLLAFLAKRRSGESDPTGTWESLDSADLEDLDGTLAATGRLRELGSSSGGDTIVTPEKPAVEDPFESTSPVDATSRQEAFAATSAGEETAADAAEGSEPYSIEDTFSSDTAINFDQSDPLAEADFHMAYGLYDQAADLVKGALAVDGGDTKLKAKLCEIYFVWGNQDGFVEAAADLKASVPAGSGDWNKVVIMGQQIAPAHDLFSGEVAGSVDDGVDIALDAETMLAEQLQEGEATGGFTEVFENAPTGSDSTVEQPADLSDISGIDFEFDEASLTGDSATQDAPALDIDSSGLDFQFDGESLDAGTVEQPIDVGEVIGQSSDTAEMALDDLDLDTGDSSVDLLEATGATSVLPDDFKVSLPDDDDATILASSAAFDLDVDDTGTTEMPEFIGGDDDANEATGIMPVGTIGEVDMDVADLTSELRIDDIGDADGDATMEQPALDGSSTMFSEQVFGGDNAVDSAADTGLNLALDDTGETNIAEVGTKLDLARAYVDMGDPDGARSILEEVLAEGDDDQRAEAEKLLGNLS
ncbi:MAG: FimV/HubP family polar landmark protein [Woeseiaceae bacterium]